MRSVLVCATLLVLAVSPFGTSARSTTATSIVLTYHNLKSGQAQTVSVTAVDLAGNPLVGALVHATVRSGAYRRSYFLPRTDDLGQSSLTFRLPLSLRAGTVFVDISIANGYLNIEDVAHFVLGSPVKVRTATAPTTLVMVARALPASVRAPSPLWISVYGRTAAGVSLTGARISATAAFREGTAHTSAIADASGAATFSIDTSRVQVDQSLKVMVTSTWHNQRGTTWTAVTVDRPQSTATPTPVPTRTATAVPTATSSPTPTWTPTEVFRSPPTPTPTSSPIVDVLPTATPTLSPSAVPTATNTPVPTATPTPSPTLTATPRATTTATQTPNCPGSQSGCIQAMMNIINATRAQHGLWPLSLNMTQSTGSGSCVGSYGHSVAMQQTGSIWHTSPDVAHQNASFDNDICIRPLYNYAAAENVGQCSNGNELQSLNCIHDLMMSESYTPGCTGSHVCNLLTSKYPEVGIGIFDSGGTIWLTEDFVM